MRLNLLLEPEGALALRELAGAVSDPTNPHYGQYLDRESLAQRIALPAHERNAIRDYFKNRGLVEECRPSLGGQVLSFRTDRAHLVAALGELGARELVERRRGGEGFVRASLPRSLSGSVYAIELARDGEVSPACALRGSNIQSYEPPTSGVAPETILRGYNIPAGTSGQGETIAVMALGGIPRPADLETFWHAHGVRPPEVRLVPVSPEGTRTHDPLDRFETTMNVQWIGAIAPGAKIVIYLIDPSAVVDPWGTFLTAVLCDHEHAPTIAVTTWSAPERQYYRAFGRQNIATLLDQAAVLGITVLAASGDWGAHGGFPRIPSEEGLVCDAFERHATFPGAEERVLSIGGTHVRAVSPWKEDAWSARVSDALRQAIGLEGLAGSGGFSEVVPIPKWQKPLLTGHYPRSDGGAAIAAHGRAQPDISLMAWGPDEGERPASYRARLDGAWRDDAGGTSVAAPIWAAIMARLNESRLRVGSARLGFFQPVLYRIARQSPEALRAIERGTTDIVLPGLDGSGRRVNFRLPGFRAARGWNPATGLGVPDVTALEHALERPEGNASDDESERSDS